MQASLTSDVQAYRAALASILDVDLDLVPEFEGLPAQMQWNGWLAGECNLASLVFEAGQINFPPGYWIARLRSPYPGYQVHSVVMAGTSLAHDPHPEPQEYAADALVLLVELLVPLDPSEPSGRYRLG